ncbi:MAG: hypothetical protein H0V27_02955 [Pyrinomonadaceae bacterium]|nr:hypothetical protein [Pyrinomonadaceae bacterium]
MASDDLEKSLRGEVDSYINARLQSLQEEVERAHVQVNEAFTRLAERLSSDGQDGASITVAISEHLRQARRLGTDEAAAESSRTKSASDVAIIKAAVDDIDNQRSQADILNSLVNRAASFAPRVIFFVIKNEQALGWRARGLEGTIGDAAVREIALPLSTRTLLSEVVQSRTTWSGAPGAHDDERMLFDKISATGQQPERIVAIPLLARGRAVAALYADSAEMDTDAINLEALETLVRVAGMGVELLATSRPAPTESRTPPPPSPYQPRAVASPASPQPEPQPSAGVSSVPTPQFATEAAPETIMPPPTATDAADASAEAEFTVPSSFPAQTTANAQTAASNGENEAYSASRASAAPPPPMETPATTAAPLGSARRYGTSADTPLPVEVGTDEERRLHNDARRFARLLVSEIKLYNDQKVREGREASDLYGRLREEIDRSRQTFDKRVSPQVAARYDYFHHELVNTLAEGDSARLGDSYPGATA